MFSWVINFITCSPSDVKCGTDLRFSESGVCFCRATACTDFQLPLDASTERQNKYTERFLQVCREPASPNTGGKVSRISLRFHKGQQPRARALFSPEELQEAARLVTLRGPLGSSHPGSTGHWGISMAIKTSGEVLTCSRSHAELRISASVTQGRGRPASS